MLEKLFTRKCIALVGEDGRQLTGAALEAAELALRQAQEADDKIWIDRNGYYIRKARKFFASAEYIWTAAGNRVRICGHPVHVNAKCCTKCGSMGHGGWKLCSHCGKNIGAESEYCPHCRYPQNSDGQKNLTGGEWQKTEDTLAEHFSGSALKSLNSDGIKISESQCGLVLEGGALVEVLGAGAYPLSALQDKNGQERDIIWVDVSEFSMPICVSGIRMSDDFESELHAVLCLRFDSSKASDFLKNLMGGTVSWNHGNASAVLSYDEVARRVLQGADTSIRVFCQSHSTGEFFKNPELRIQLEDFLAKEIQNNLDSAGVSFVRLSSVDFASEAFEKLRKEAGDLEIQRRSNEFKLRANQVANEATRKEAFSEYEMEKYMAQLAQEKEIEDNERRLELERLHEKWEQERIERARQKEISDTEWERQKKISDTEWEQQQKINALKNNIELDIIAVDNKHEQEKKAKIAENDLMSLGEDGKDIKQNRELERQLKQLEYKLKEAKLIEAQEDVHHEGALNRRLGESKISVEIAKLEAQKKEIVQMLEHNKVLLDIAETKEWEEVRRKRESDKFKMKIELVDALKHASIESMLAIEENPEKRSILMEIYKMKLQNEKETNPANKSDSGNHYFN